MTLEPEVDEQGNAVVSGENQPPGDGAVVDDNSVVDDGSVASDSGDQPSGKASSASGDNPPEPLAVSGGGKNVTLPSKALKRRIDQAKERGRKAAMDEFETIAKKYGFDSVDAFFKATADGHKAAAASASNAKQSHDDDDDDDKSSRSNGRNNGRKTGKRYEAKHQAEKDQWRRERAQLRKKHSTQLERSKALESTLDLKEAEMAIRQTAASAGVRDVDYAVHIVGKELAGKSEEELNKFDEVAYFAGLKKTHPYLFGEVIKPASTGADSGASPPALSPGDIAAKQAANGKKTVNDMNPAEFELHVRKMGINPSL